MPVSERTFQQLALEDPEGHWELYCGRLRRKPGMTFAHNHAGVWLTVQLAQQLDRRRFDVRSNAGHVRRSPENYFIPDVFVIPLELAEPFRERRDVLEWYDAPLPLVVEIWLIHPFDRTLTAWRRQPDGSYVESHYTGGTVQPVALPDVTIDLDTLFD